MQMKKQISEKKGLKNLLVKPAKTGKRKIKGKLFKS